MNEQLQSSAEVALELGLSKERVNKFAKRVGIPKLGGFYVWDKDHKSALKSRIGMRGHKLS